jgi:DNA-binding transcriptional MerR regulator
MESWRIDELAERAAAALDGDGGPVASGRVTPLPDRRMLRYYTTLGLLDRPEVRGRVAYYGRRHLLQVVAIKRLQAGGATLAQVQQELAGATTSTLERIAQLPAGADAPAPAAPRAFWKGAPAPSPEGAIDPAVVGAVRLAPGVTLVLDASASLTPADAQAIKSASAALLAHLHAAGLIDEPAPPTTTTTTTRRPQP